MVATTVAASGTRKQLAAGQHVARHLWSLEGSYSLQRVISLTASTKTIASYYDAWLMHEPCISHAQ